MLEDQRAGGIEASVEETLLVGAELYAGVACTEQGVGQIFTAGDVADVDGFFIGAARAGAVDEQLAVFGDVVDLDRGVLVGTELGGIDEAFILTVQAATEIDGALVLIREALFEEEIAAAFDGNAITLDALEFGEFVDHGGSDFDLREILLGVLHLLGDPGAGLGAVLVFEPAIGVGDLRAVDLLGDGLLLRRRRRRKCDAVAAFDFGGLVGGVGHHGEEEKEEQKTESHGR